MTREWFEYRYCKICGRTRGGKSGHLITEYTNGTGKVYCKRCGNTYKYKWYKRLKKRW